MTSKQIVLDTLEFKNSSHRTARELWTLPWAWYNHEQELKDFLNEEPSDFSAPVLEYKKLSPVEKGDPNNVGIYYDAWGCKFVNIQRGIIGEVKEPLVRNDDWEDVDNVHIPEEWLSFDVEQGNRACEVINDKFINIGCPRPFEQLQFIRGTVNLYMDLMDPPKKMLEFFEKMHDFYCRLITKFAEIDGVDGIQFMDDWGSQNALLISPELWKKYFKPMYRDFIDIAKKHGKKIFMHSDGYILDIIPDLIDMGLDALNSQIFCMGAENMKQFKGKITFWGEIDRQHLLPYGSIEDIRKAVRKVHDNLYDNGGCIAQCEFGPGGKFENVKEVFREWDRLTSK